MGLVKSGVPVNAWEVDPVGYSSASARPYDAIKLQVCKAAIHSPWPQAGMKKADHLFNSFRNMTEVSGFENLSGITSAKLLGPRDVWHATLVCGVCFPQLWGLVSDSRHRP